jgi:hypothetical protein
VVSVTRIAELSVIASSTCRAAGVRRHVVKLASLRFMAPAHRVALLV